MTSTPRVRLSIIGVIAISLFAAMFARLYYLQVAATRTFQTAAISNQIREVQKQATRGRILDRNGKVLVDNLVVTAVTVSRRTPKKDLATVVDKLGELLNITPQEIRDRIDDPRISPYSAVPVATNVPIEKVTYIEEHLEEFPGVAVEPINLRRYPNGQLAAHVLGYTGEISDDEIKNVTGYQLGDTIGKTGVEAEYEKDLRGRPSIDRLAIDSKGNVVRVLSREEAQAGNDVVLSLDADVQRVAEQALVDGISQARKLRDTNSKTKFETFRAPAGSVAVLDATDGSVVASASFPTFNPNDFVNGIPSSTWKYLNDPANNYPLNNRVLLGQYAPGSTFKPFSAVAFDHSGVRGPNDVYVDAGGIKFAGQEFKNDNGEVHGAVDLAQALTVSSDAYFYSGGGILWQKSYGNDPNGYALQDTARAFGFGSPTQVDFGTGSKGRVPDPKWKEAVHKERPDVFPYPTWLPGDNILLSIGQGDVLTTPLQLAQGYAVLANNGTVNVPHVGLKLVDSKGNVVRTVTPPPGPSVDMTPEEQAAIMRGLEGVVRNSDGTAYQAFAGFPFDTLPVGGKTGTAQVANKQNTSVFVGLTRTDRPYVVAVLVEEAGYGASVAAPIARTVFEQLAGVTPGPVAVRVPGAKVD
ncbi:MAG: penicillin-binding protein 2 [Acidimicrobiia bacterium]